MHLFRSWLNNHHKALIRALTVLLAFTAASLLSHWSALANGALFAIEGDSLRQTVPGVMLLDQSVLKGELTWSWSYGLGGDAFLGLSYYYATSPFYWIGFLLRLISGAVGDAEATLRWKLILSVAKQVLIMALMYRLHRREGRTRLLALLGAVIYGISVRYTYYSLIFDFFTDAYVYLPCLVMAYDRYGRRGALGERGVGAWLPLAAVVALSCANSFYFGYMNCLFAGSLFLIFSLGQGGGCKGYAKRIGALVAIGAAGVLLSAVGLVPGVAALLRADRAPTAMAEALLPARQFISGLWHNLYQWNTLLIFPLFLIAALPGLLEKDRPTLKKRGALALFWLAVWCMPLGRSVMNGLSYPTDRFFYIVVFAAAYLAPELLEAYGARHKKAELLWMAGGAAALGAVFLRKLELPLWESAIPTVVAFGCMEACFLLTGLSPYCKRRTGVLLGGLCLLAAIAFSAVSVSGGTVLPGQAYAQLMGDSAAQRAEAENAALEDGSRIHDRRTELSQLRTENRGFVSSARTADSYSSLITYNVHDWLKRRFNVYTFRIQTHYYRGLDDRLFLETAWNVNTKLSAPEALDASLSAGWDAAQFGGAALLTLKASTGFDLWYDTAMPAGEWEKLTYAQKDAMLLQCAAAEGLTGSYPPPRENTATRAVIGHWREGELVNCRLDENGWLWAEENASVTFPLEKEPSQGEYLVTLRLEESVGRDFTVGVNGRSVEKLDSGYEFNYDYPDYSFRVPCDADSITVTLTPGIYVTAEILASFNSYQGLAQWVEALNRVNVEELTIRGPYIAGRVNADADGILALSMANEPGWSCWVDGKRTRLVTVNGIFPGIELARGSHTVELRYVCQPLLWGAAVTAAGALGIALMALIQKQRDKKRREGPRPSRKELSV